MLRIAEHFEDSDVGRQRQGNEDHYFARAPLFVVADGMGGAQAGEVASELAVREFEGGLPDGEEPAASLVGLIRSANRRIHELSRADADRAGMGTTLTAAYLDGDMVHVAHVGDSRCYLLRDGDLIRLTRDHTLVDELVQRGKLTEEQAESHPQRSVITRALGPDPDVDVDIDRYPARPGDLFLLCSDGLTGMLGEAGLKALLASGRPLHELGRALIAAANDAGGRDNITVILFRIEEVERRGAPDAATVESATVPGGGAGAVAMQAPPRREARPASGGARAAPTQERPTPPRRRRARTGLLLVGLAVVLPLLVAAWLATRAVYFIGTDPVDGRTVAIFRGLPYEAPFGVDLYETYYRSGTTLAAVPARRRASFTEHRLRSRDDAERLIVALEQGKLR